MIGRVRRWPSPLVAVLIVASLGFSIATGTDFAAAALTGPLVVSDALSKVDAIVVIGAGAQPDNLLLPDSAYTLLRGLQLFKAGYAPIIILSGGSHRGSKQTDPQAMATIAMSLGIPPEALILSVGGTRISAQAQAIAAVLSRHRLKSIALISPPIRSRRAAAAFRQAGIKTVSASGMSPSTYLLGRQNFQGRLTAVQHAFYEYLALSYYWIRGDI
jgi:uncharacterized SAM-binding protein YcdF (DUF218 family)